MVAIIEYARDNTIRDGQLHLIFIHTVIGLICIQKIMTPNMKFTCKNGILWRLCRKYTLSRLRFHM